MPLVTMKELMDDAAIKGYAVPAFNAYNMETVSCMVDSAVKLKAPLIIQVYSRLFNSDRAKLIAAMVREKVGPASVPVALHLDHGGCESDVVRAIRFGYTSVMIDVSTLPLEQNIAATAAIVRVCQSVGIPVEGELGHVGSTKDDPAGQEFTDPAEAQKYCRATQVDSLAVMVGTAHGIYKKAPKLDIERIKRIKQLTGKPLVLHGGSGVPDEELKAAIRAGVSKINFATDICCAYLAGVKELTTSSDMVWSQALDLFAEHPMQKVSAFIEAKIQLLEADHRVKGGF
jgi:fructose-bisphosphate aldolase class II